MFEYGLLTGPLNEFLNPFVNDLVDFLVSTNFLPPKIAPRPLDLDFYLKRSWKSDEDDLPDPPRVNIEEIINIREYPSQQNKKAD